MRFLMQKTKRFSIRSAMKLVGSVFFTFVILTTALNLDYLDPIKLQTEIPFESQQILANDIIRKYYANVNVEINPLLFKDKKDVFVIQTKNDLLHIKASTGVAALWGFNYYLKKYCKSHIGWQVKNINIPKPLPQADEAVVANDRFRYYQNIYSYSYSYLWWDEAKWLEHVQWMAMNGINVALAPTAQEAAWIKVYKRFGMSDEDIEEHFTGPAYLPWLRMGVLKSWGGPLPRSWHDNQKKLQISVVSFMYQLGMIPIVPAFNGIVPRAFAKIYPNVTFFSVETSTNKFDNNYCCGLFLNPNDPLFLAIGVRFLREVTLSLPYSHIYNANPFYEIKVEPWSTALVQNTAKSIFSAMTEVDREAIWLVQNCMFVHDPTSWSKIKVKSFLTAVPKGRMLVLDMESEQSPQFEVNHMYYGQPFIWCMLHNIGGTLGMFGNMQIINYDVYEMRSRPNATMVGIGLTPEGINQNYVVYDLMLESAWRNGPVKDLDVWVEDYAERRYGCNLTASAWRYLLRSVYSFNGHSKVNGKYVITQRPSFKIRPWAWYESYNLFQAYKQFILIGDNCDSPGFYHDLVDVARQALQYRVGQLYRNLLIYRFSNSWVFKKSIELFLSAMKDMARILEAHEDFSLNEWLSDAGKIGINDIEKSIYETNAINLITIWGPNGENRDYACKQWAEMLRFYYIPRWETFLDGAWDATSKNELFDEKATQNIVWSTIEKHFTFTILKKLSDIRNSFIEQDNINKSVMAPNENQVSALDGVSLGIVLDKFLSKDSGSTSFFPSNPNQNSKPFDSSRYDPKASQQGNAWGLPGVKVNIPSDYNQNYTPLYNSSSIFDCEPGNKTCVPSGFYSSPESHSQTFPEFNSNGSPEGQPIFDPSRSSPNSPPDTNQYVVPGYNPNNKPDSNAYGLAGLNQHGLSKAYLYRPVENNPRDPSNGPLKDSEDVIPNSLQNSIPNSNIQEELRRHKRNLSEKNTIDRHPFHGIRHFNQDSTTQSNMKKTMQIYITNSQTKNTSVKGKLIISIATELFLKWGTLPGVEDLPLVGINFETKTYSHLMNSSSVVDNTTLHK